MRELDKAGVLGMTPGQMNDVQVEAVSVRRRNRRVRLRLPNGLAASSDSRIRRELAQILAQCGFAPVIASNIAETRVALFRHEVSIALCNNYLDDGNYEDVLRLLHRSDRPVPVIVLSRTGDWAEFLAAIRVGVFDYLAYPTIPGELQRVIRNALGGKHQLDAA